MPTTSPGSFHVMTKPIGPICNLDCKYCYYLEKENLFPANENFKMQEDVLETYIRQYITGQASADVNFAWQGGEPTLLGVEYFRKVVELQRKQAGGKRIANALHSFSMTCAAFKNASRSIISVPGFARWKPAIEAASRPWHFIAGPNTFR